MFIKKFQNLPKEIIDVILEYQGYHKERNGKYMKQFDQKKYNFLYKIHCNIVLSKGWGTECIFLKKINSNIYKFIITIIVYPTMVEWSMQKIPIYVVTPEIMNDSIYNHSYQTKTIIFITHN